MALPIAQSPSVEDLLSARSKRFHHNLATSSIYSTITTLSAKTELDLSESARLAMAQESADPVWSPSLSSNYGDDSDGNDARDDEDDDGSSTQNEHVRNINHDCDQASSPNLESATPTISESEYSRSPSLGSVRMAAIVQKAVPTSGLGISSLASSIQDSTQPGSSSSSSIDSSQYTPTASPSKRVLNARNLIINTGGIGAARPYPHQSTTPPIALPNSAKIEHSPPPLTSRSVPESSNINNFSSPLRTATLPPVPQTAGPIQRTLSQKRASQTKLVRRSSTDSSLSYLSSPLLDEDDTLGPHKASLLRMQSFLGPKMKHISPAPWSTDADASSVVSSSSILVSETASAVWSEVESEIGSVHMATKSVARSGKVTGKDGTANTATGTLKGLGLAIASASAVVANAAAGGVSRPSMSSERSAKSRTTTASSAFSTWSGTSRGTTNDGSKFGLSRSQSQEPFDASGIPLPPLPSPSATATMKVTNITRSKSPENYPPLPSSAVTATFPPLSRSVSPADKLDSEPGSETPFGQLKTVTSAPEGNATFTAASACIQALSTSLPESSIQAPSKSGKKPPSLPRKRPPIVHQDSTFSNTTSTCTGESYVTGMSHSTSISSLPAPNSDPSDLASKASSPNGMKLISLRDAQERERERGNQAAERRAEAQQAQQQQQQYNPQHQADIQRMRQAQTPTPVNPTIPPHPSTVPPRPPPAKTLKTKKSGFLKLFKSKEDHSQAPAIPRPSTDSTPSPKTSHGFAHTTRNVSGPTDPRKIDSVLHIGATSPTIAASEPKTPASSEFASALPFPHQRAPNHATDIRGGDDVRKTNTSIPPQVSLIKPSPDLSKKQAPFADSGSGLTVQDHRAMARAPQSTQGEALAPSLSLRPVSMMLSSMPPDFLAEMEKTVKKGAHLQAVQTPGGSSTASFDSLGGQSSPARTPDTPSFVFFDSDNNATPPPGQTPNTPATEQFNDSPTSHSSNSKASQPVFGLPTPPHSASSSRTFSASNLPPMPTSPVNVPDQVRELAITAAYKAKIVELEQLVIGLRAELNATKGENIQITLSDPDCKESASAKKTCNACGCSCKTTPSSVLSRPRIVGHGNMFSSGRA